MQIARSLESWPLTTSTRKAVVNSFGSGGTNAMLVLESVSDIHYEVPNGTMNRETRPLTNGYANLPIKRTPSYIFTMSARSERSLIQWIQDLKKYLQQNVQINLYDLSYTLTNRRSNFQWRSSVIAQDISTLIEKLGVKEAAPVKVPAQVANILVFNGQGAQYFRMGYELIFTNSEFSRSIQISGQYLKSLGASWCLVEELCKDEGKSQLNDSRYGQPASTAIQVGLVDLLRSWKVHPSAVIGHRYVTISACFHSLGEARNLEICFESCPLVADGKYLEHNFEPIAFDYLCCGSANIVDSSGEIAAAYCAGVIDHPTTIRVAYERSFLAEAARKRSSELGAMMATGLGEKDVNDDISQLTSSVCSMRN